MLKVKLSLNLSCKRLRPTPKALSIQTLYPTRRFKMSGESPTCFTLPAVTAGNYESKGKYQKVNGLNACMETRTYCPSRLTWRSVDVTGPSSASKAILHVYDVFGITPQTLQGADRLAAALGVLVVMPDWFKGEPMQSDWMPPDTDEKKKLGRTCPCVSE